MAKETELTPLQGKLLKIQSELKAPKNRYNAFGKYNYRDAEGILEAVKPLLVQEGLLMTLSDEIISDGGRYHIKSTVRIELGELFKEVTGFAREEQDKKGMDGSQITGASSSYARKYALNGMFLIDDTKDSDGTNDGSKEEKKVTKTTEASTGADKAKTETKATKTLTPIEINTQPFIGAANWIVESKIDSITGIEKLRAKYAISAEVEKALVSKVAEINAGKK